MHESWAQDCRVGRGERKGEAKMLCNAMTMIAYMGKFLRTSQQQMVVLDWSVNISGQCIRLYSIH